MTVAFDIGILPNKPVLELVPLVKAAEELGFSGVWIADSQSIFRDAYAALAVCATHTRHMMLATGVTNPLTRHPAVLAGSIATINEISGGRAVLGIGTGESAVYTLGLKRARLAQVEETAQVIRSLLARQPTPYQGKEIQMTWPEQPVPVYFAASGPKSLRLAGRVADGVLFQVGADPHLIQYGLERIKAGAAEAGRPLSEVKLCARLACSVDEDRAAAREAIKSYAATAAGTVYLSVPHEDLPADLTHDIQRMKEQYNYLEHARVGARHAELVTDRIMDAMAVAGTSQEAIPRLEKVVEMGVDRIVIPLAVKDPLALVHTLGEKVLPHFQ